MNDILISIVNSKLWLFDSVGFTSYIVLLWQICLVFLLVNRLRCLKIFKNYEKIDLIIFSIIIYCFFIFFFIEISSLFNILTSKMSWIFKIFLTFLLLNPINIKLSKIRKVFFSVKFYHLLEIFKKSKKKFYLLPFIGLGLVLIGTFLIALIASPNNWDSMTYHLPRIMHWQQNNSIGFYDTSVTRQLYSSPGAEYLILYLQLLTGGDRLANFIQWFALFGSLLVVWNITKQLGGNYCSRVFAVLFTASIPMAILQATSTQTDLIASFWILCSIYLILKIVKDTNLVLATLLGLSGGIALLTKATSLPFLLPFGFYLLYRLFLLQRFKSYKIVIITLGVACMVYLPFLARNFHYYGSFTSPDSRMITNENITLSVVSSNLIRNLTMHADLGLKNNHSVVSNFTKKIHNVLGLNLNATESTYGGNLFSVIPYQNRFDEDTATNPVHLALIIVSAVILVLRYKIEKNYFLLGLLSLVLFSALFRWQIWGSRLQLPFFIIIAPAVSIILTEKIKIKYQSLFMSIVAICFIFYTFPFVTNHGIRPLRGPESILVRERYDLYFAHNRYMKNYYTEAVKHIPECQSVGLIIKNEAFEYPLLLSIKKKNPDIKFYHLLAENSLIKYSNLHKNNMCAIIKVDPYPLGGQLLLTQDNGTNIQMIWSSPNNEVAVYKLLINDEKK